MAVLAAPVVLAVLLVVLLAGAAGGVQTPPAGCGAGGTATTIGEVTLDAEQMSNAQLIVTLTAGRALPAQAAVIAVATAYTESGLRNDLVQRDHDSIGLFQLRVGLWTAEVAGDPGASTGWFLARLVAVPNWRAIPLTDAAAIVQRPAEAYRGRYATAQPLATGIVGQLWPTTSANAASARPASVPNQGLPGSAGPDASGLVAEAEPPVICPAGAGAGGGAATDTVPCAGGGGQVTAGPGGVPIRLCAVGPFVVDTTIAGPVTALLAAASAAGLDLGGGGHRSNAEQVALRRANCGPSTYDIYQRPAGECSPATARPGMSMHEWGLALDLTESGALIRSSNTAAWQWLNANAGSFGLRGLLGEPWHWSTSGR